VVGIETGPGAFVTGLIGGILGSMGGQAVADAAFEEAQHMVSEIKALPQSLDNYVQTMLLPTGPKPWGNW